MKTSQTRLFRSQPSYLIFPTLGYSLYTRPFDVSAGAAAPWSWLLATPWLNFSSWPNKKTQWRFHWKWHLLLKSAGEHWNINFIKNVYTGVCTWSILIMWHITHSTLASGNGAVVPLEAVIDSFFFFFFLFKHITSLCVHLKKNNVVHYRYVFTQPFKQWLCSHNWAQNVSKSSVTTLMDCTDPRLLVMTRRSCLC